ncbi:MAG: hypothetical protein Kow00127_25440 [Bacteroidales bacterium]
MAKNENKKSGVLLRIVVVLNIIIFGGTGIQYLLNHNDMIGYGLLAAGLINLLYLLFTLRMRNYFFAFLNFVFALISIIVTIDYLSHGNNQFAMIWIFITLYYLITGFLIVLGVNRAKAKMEKATVAEKSYEENPQPAPQSTGKVKEDKSVETSGEETEKPDSEN